MTALSPRRFKARVVGLWLRLGDNGRLIVSPFIHMPQNNNFDPTACLLSDVPRLQQMARTIEQRRLAGSRLIACSRSLPRA